METFYISPDQFWDWFDRQELEARDDEPKTKRARVEQQQQQQQSTKPRSIRETEAALRVDARYIILYGAHKPGKKNKIWSNDGYLTLVGQTAHLCDLKGRMLEEPMILDEIDLKLVQELGELTIGSTEVQVVELDK